MFIGQERVAKPTRDGVIMEAISLASKEGLESRQYMKPFWITGGASPDFPPTECLTHLVTLNLVNAVSV